MKILIDTMLPGEWFDRLAEHELVPDTALYGGNCGCGNTAVEKASEAEVLTTNFYKPVRKDLLDKLPKLKLVTQFGVGYDNIDVAECHRRGILVTNTPQPVIEPTAELCMALIMGIARRTAEMDRGIRENKVQFGLLKNLGHSLYGKTLGIIGMGNIGRAVARRAIAGGMKVIYHNRHEINGDVLSGLTLQAQDSPVGVVVPTWLFGSRSCDTSAWKDGLPEDVLKRIAFWYPRALNYPLTELFHTVSLEE